VIKVFSYRPEFFNNNGDQGNLEALAHFTKQQLEPSSVEEADFVLFGDGSIAAMNEFQSELEGLVPALQDRLDERKPTLLVGSCYEFFSERLTGLPEPSFGERSSEFREAMADGLVAKGYRNATWIASDLFVSGSFVGTTLFGPVLAKSPELLARIAKDLGTEVFYSDLEKIWISKL
jgi:hypothetical protein